MCIESVERVADGATASSDSGVTAKGETGPGQTITSVERAADVMLLFARANSQSLGVTEIADQLSLPKAAVHRILSSLRSRSLVELDESTRRYLLGPASMTLGLRYLARLDVRRLALPALHELSTSTQETATLSLRTGDTRVYVEQVTPVREVIMSVSLGVPFPLHAGASSKAFLAFLPEEQVSAYLDRGLAALTGPRSPIPASCGPNWPRSGNAAGHTPTESASREPRPWPRHCSTILASPPRPSASAGRPGASPPKPTRTPGAC